MATISQSALENGYGDKAAIISGTVLDAHLVTLGVSIAREAQCKLLLIPVLEIPRSLPHKGCCPFRETPERSQGAAGRPGQVGLFTVHGRAAGPPIVDETSDLGCGLLLIGWLHTSRSTALRLEGDHWLRARQRELCVWLVQDLQDFK